MSREMARSILTTFCACPHLTIHRSSTYCRATFYLTIPTSKNWWKNRDFRRLFRANLLEQSSQRIRVKPNIADPVGSVIGTPSLADKVLFGTGDSLGGTGCGSKRQTVSAAVTAAAVAGTAQYRRRIEGPPGGRRSSGSSGEESSWRSLPPSMTPFFAPPSQARSDAEGRVVLRHRGDDVLQRSQSAPLPRAVRPSMAKIALADGRIIAGALPPTALRLVSEWSLAHRRELEDNWARARADEPLERIPGPDDE